MLSSLRTGGDVETLSIAAGRPGVASSIVPFLERWVLRVAVILLPLALWWDTYDGVVLPKLLLARLLLLGLVVLFLARSVTSRTLVLRRTALDLPVVLFLASAGVSTALAANRNVGIFGTYGRYDGLLTLITYAGLFWLSVQMLHRSGDAHGLIRTLLVGGYVVAAVAIYQSVIDSLHSGAVAPAFGTLGNPNVLGAYLAMLIPLAYGELVRAQSRSARILALNALVVFAVALLLTFSRSAWLGVTVAAVVVLAAAPKRAWRAAIVGLCLLALLGVVGRTVSSASGLEHLLEARAMSVIDPRSWENTRLHIWRDATAVIASRPVFGYGPDSFGLVFPRLETGDWGVGARDTHQQIDKAHAEVLQIAATQGLVGLAAYLSLLGAFIRTAWRGRGGQGMILFAAWIGYTLTVQLNFTALAAAFPFWIFAAACVTSWNARPATVSVRLHRGRAVRAVSAVALAGVVALLVVSVIRPYVADADLQHAASAAAMGSRTVAAAWAGQARRLAPQESVYAVEAGNMAFQSARWVAARDAYRDAARLGTYDPRVYRNLALADTQLRNRMEARAAALKALELNRFDPANQALVAQFAATGGVTRTVISPINQP